MGELPFSFLYPCDLLSICAGAVADPYLFPSNSKKFLYPNILGQLNKKALHKEGLFGTQERGLTASGKRY